MSVDPEAGGEPNVASNLALHEEVARRRAHGEHIVHLGFGESRFPIHPGLVDALRHGVGDSGYADVAGTLAARSAVAGYWSRRALPTAAHDVVLGPGSKPLLFALFAALGGPIVVPRPCWVTYPAQIRAIGAQVISVPVPPDGGGVPDPDLLDRVLVEARAAANPVKAVVLTLPDNPTGTLASAAAIERVCRSCAEHDVLVVSDEIYGDVLHPGVSAPVSPARIVPDRVVVTAGLSKSHSLGGWRIGVARFPATATGDALRRGVLARGSEIWSSLAAPMQAVAEYAYNEPEGLTQWVGKCAATHAAVTRELRQVFLDVGASCAEPAGGFYLYPDFGQHRKQLAWRRVHTGAEFASFLLNRYGVAVLAAEHFGEVASALRFRAATSLLYGDGGTAGRCLDSEHPGNEQNVRDALSLVRAAFADLLG